MAPSAIGARWALRLNSLWGALGMTALLLLLRRYFSWRTTVLAVVLVGFCSDWWYQSRGLYSEVAAGAFLIASLCFAINDKPLGSATALAVSILFRPTNLLALPIWAWRVWRKPFQALTSALIIAAGGLLFALYNWARFGSALRFGYPSGNLNVPLLTGLHLMSISPGRSLFVYSPILLLAIPGVWLFYRKEKTFTILCAILIMSYALVIASWGPLGWGLTWGMRLMTPIVPVLGFLMASTLEYFWRNKLLLSLALILGLAGLAVQVLALLRDPTHVLVHRVMSGEVKYEDTLYTVRDSWMALQIRSLSDWQPCNLDSYTLRHWLTNCPQ
jgi:hypothetical protein